MLTIKIIDTNDNTPTFDSNQLIGFIKENQPIGTPVSFKEPMIITDLDADDQHFFSLPNNSLFTINVTNGNIYSNAVLDREVMPMHNLKVKVEDSGGLSSLANFTVMIQDINDHAPEFEAHLGTLYVKEDTEIGTVIFNVKAMDDDIENNGKVRYSMTGGAGIFEINPSTGRCRRSLYPMIALFLIEAVDKYSVIDIASVTDLKQNDNKENNSKSKKMFFRSLPKI